MKKNSKKVSLFKNFLYFSLGIVIFLIIWEISSLLINKHDIFPDVIDTFKQVIELLMNSGTYSSIGVSIGLTLITTIISLILSIILGTIAGIFEGFRNVFNPIVNIFKVFPTACITILLVIFVKSVYSICIVVFLISFPIIYEGVVNGILNINDDVIMALRLDGIKNRNSIFKVIIPQVLPYIYVGLITSLGISLKAEIMSEIIIGSSSIRGLGRLLYVAAKVDFDYQKCFGIAIVILLTFGIIDLILNIIKSLLKKSIK